MTRLLILVAAAAISTFNAAAAFASSNACEREMVRAAEQHDVPISVLYAVGLTETGRRGSLQPFAMNVEGRSHFPEGIEDALRVFDDAREGGAVLIDVGCMQINHHYHGARFKSVRAMFDPGQNVDYAASFLIRLYREHGSWSMAVARYHAGPNNNPAQKKYICRVIRNLVASGFGAWTSQARAFCVS